MAAKARTPFEDTSVSVSRSQEQIRSLLRDAGAQGVQFSEEWHGEHPAFPANGADTGDGAETSGLTVADELLAEARNKANDGKTTGRVEGLGGCVPPFASFPLHDKGGRVPEGPAAE